MLSQDMVRRSLHRISKRDPEIRAWLHVDDRGALAHAKAIDENPHADLPLRGFTVGVKDVFNTCDMPTTYNSLLYSGFRPSADASCIEVLRAAGAVIIGKTDTTEFATAGRRAITSNPHDLSRSAGGSSSGSAAAVADHHVRIALGTQTAGSLIRPASFCGIYGFKPTWGLVSTEGMKLYAPSLDTVGWYSRSIEDSERVCEVFNLAAPEEKTFPHVKIGVYRTPNWEHGSADMQEAFDRAATSLANVGVEIIPLEFSEIFERLTSLHQIMMHREGAAAYLNLVRTRGDLLHDDFHARVETTRTMGDMQLREAYDTAAQARIEFESKIANLDAVLVPSAPGIAPFGRDPGNAIFNRIWTMLHMPVLSMPWGRSENGMPIGISLVGRRFSDRAVLRVGRHLEKMLNIPQQTALPPA